MTHDKYPEYDNGEEAGPDRSINNNAGTVASPWSAAVSRNRLTTSDMSFATPLQSCGYSEHVTPKHSEC